MTVFSSSAPSFLRSTRRQTLRVFGALGAATALAACSDGSTFEPLAPSRFVSFGDGWSDLGQSGNRFTVNDGSINIWVQQMAARYGKTITSQASGGLGFARGGARVDTGANSIAAQITAFLSGHTIGASDVLAVDAGLSELIALASTLSGAALNTAAEAAGKTLALQVRRLTAAGGKYVVLANSIDLGKTPFALSLNRAAELNRATRAFNDALKVALADVTGQVLLIDNEAYVNLVHTTPTSYLGASPVVNAAACTAATFNSTTCTPATANANYAAYLFADDRHPTPAAHRLIGDNAYNKVKERW
jgi:outer membrane lipase/esterase